MRLRTVGTALLLPAALVLGGCSDQAASPAARADAEVYPAVTLDQASDILDSVDEATAAARSKRDVRLAGGRLIGPAKQLSNAQATIATRLHRPAEQPAAARVTRLLVPSGGSWPRVLLAVTEVSGVSTPVIRILRSGAARQPYGLWGEPQMLPGATVPATAGADTGVAVLSPKATGLVMTPADAVTRYAAVLTAEGSGRPAPGASAFAADPLRTQTAAASAAERAKTSGGGTFGTAHTAVPTSTVALAAADGGAIVVGEIQQQTVITLRAGSQTQFSGALAALSPRPTYTQRVVRTSAEVVVLYVPRAGSGTSTVSLIAADRGDVSVAGA